MLCFRRTLGILLLGAATVGLGVTASVAIAQVAVSANDNKLVLVNGVATVQQNPAPDTVAIIDLKEFPPKIVAEIEAPVSVVGPPLSVAITPDEGLALVTAAMKINPQDPTKQVPDNRLSSSTSRQLLRLSSRPSKLVKGQLVCPSTAKGRSRWWRTALRGPCRCSVSVAKT